MALETVVHIGDLVVTNPASNDPKSQGDDHLRNIKTALANDFAGFTGAVCVTGVDGGAVNAYTLTPAKPLVAYGLRMAIIFSPPVTNSGAATLNVSALGAMVVRRVDGTDLVAGDLVAGSLYVALYNGAEFRLLAPTKNYVDQLAFSAALPAQAGNAGRIPVTNGVATSWVPPALSAAATTTSAANVVLNAASAGVQAIAMTAKNLSVVLPDETTLPINGIAYFIQNVGANTFFVQDSAGSIVACVPPDGKAMLISPSNAAAAGNWRVGNVSDGQFLQYGITGTPANIAALTLGYGAIVALSATSAVYVCISSGATQLVGIILSINADGTFSTLNGTGTTIWALATSWEQIVLTPLSATTFLVSTVGANETPTYAICTVAGSTLTPGALATPFAGAPRAGIAHAVLSPALALLAAADSTGTLRIAAATIAGTTLTPGAVTALANTTITSSSKMCIAPLSATSAVIFYSALTTGALTAIIVTITGGTSFNTGAPQTLDSTNLPAGNPGPSQAIAASATQIVVMNGTNLYLIGLAGSVLSELTFASTGGQGANSLVMTSPTSFKVFDIEVGTGRPMIRQANIVNGNVLAITKYQYLNPSASVSAMGGSANAGVIGSLISGTKMIYSYTQTTSNYPYAAVGTFLP